MLAYFKVRIARFLLNLSDPLSHTVPAHTRFGHRYRAGRHDHGSSMLLPPPSPEPGCPASRTSHILDAYFLTCLSSG